MELEYREIKVNLPEDISDLPLKNYFDIMKVLETMPSEGVDEWFLTPAGQLKFFEIVEAFVGDIDELLISEINDLGVKITELITKFEVPTANGGWFEADGVIYSTGQLDELSGGEYISIKVYQEKFGNDVYSYAPFILAILCRPAKITIDDETGKEVIEVEKFNKKDIRNLEWRANLFLNEVPAKHLIPAFNFFLNMKKTI